MTFIQKLFLAAIIISSIAALILESIWVSIFLNAAALFSLYIVIPAVNWKRNRVESRAIFEALNIYAFGKMWVGKKAEVVLVKDTDKFEGVETLARTIEGHWFIVEISISNKGKAKLKKLHEINTEAAKTILKGEPGIYERYFGISDS